MTDTKNSNSKHTPGPRARCSICKGKLTPGLFQTYTKLRSKFSPHPAVFQCNPCVNRWEAFHGRPALLPEAL